MRKAALAFAACGMLLAAGSANADGPMTVDQFMSNCTRVTGACRANITDYVSNGVVNKYICLPDGQKVESAAEDLLSRLRKARNDSARAGKDIQDVEWEEASALWPCAGALPPGADSVAPAPPPPPDAPPDAAPSTPQQ